MIKSVKGSATRRFLEGGKSGFPGMNEQLAFQRPAELNAAVSLGDFGRLISVGLHKLKGNLRAFWSIDINGPWRILFKFENGHAHEVHLFDPH